MFKKYKIALIGVFVITSFLVTMAVSAANPNFFLKRGNAITLLKDSWVFGNATNPIANGRFTELTVDTFNIGAIDMGGENITNANIITAVKYVATSTTEASVFPLASSTQITVDTDAWLAVSGGRVGIGTTTPAYELDVNGSLRVTTGNNILLGSTQWNSNDNIDGSVLAINTVDDTAIDWGTGANQISSCDMPDHDGHTVRDTFIHILNRGVAEVITVSLTGGLGISWTAGEIYDIANHTFVATDAGSGSVTNTAVNYLKWVSGTTLTLSTSDATGNEVLIAIGSTYDGNIDGYREMSLLDESLANIRRCARAVFPTRVTSGMSVHEDTDVTNPLDVTMDAGVFCKELQERITPVEIKSRNTAIVRHFHTGGVWDSDTNAQIETTNYDNGTQKTAIPASKWVKGLFLYMNGKIGFVYPTEYFTNKAEAEEAALPAMPTGLEPIPKLTAIVYQQGVGNFTTAVWQDVREGIGEQTFGGVSDHGSLAGLSDDDHPQYILVDGTRAFTGNQSFGGNDITNVANLTLSNTLSLGTGTTTASNGFDISAGCYAVNGTCIAGAGDPDQNLWLTIAGDSGSTAANITTDTLTIAGGDNLTSVMSGDTLTMNASDMFTLTTWYATTTQSLINSLPALVGVGTLTSGATGAGFTVDLDASTLTCTNCIDIGDNTNLAAGRSLTLSGDSVEADAELYHHEKCLYFEDPIATDDFKSIFHFRKGATITGMWCESDQTVNLDLQLDDGTPADVNGTDLVCDSTPADDTSLGGDTGAGAGERLDLAITSVSGTPTWVSICFDFEYSD